MVELGSEKVFLYILDSSILKHIVFDGQFNNFSTSFYRKKIVIILSDFFSDKCINFTLDMSAERERG